MAVLGGTVPCLLAEELVLEPKSFVFSSCCCCFLVFTFILGLFLFVCFLCCGSVFFHAIS